MIRFFAVLMWVLIVAMAPAEKYYVTFVKGKVVLERGRKPVKVGDALNPDDKLIFLDQQARISCISPGKGRFDINPKAQKTSVNGELLAVLKSSLIPASGTYHLSTRSLFFEGYDPKTYFRSAETGNRILLITGEKLSIAPSYKLDASNFFFLQYKNNGKNEVRKVPHQSNELLFSPDLITGGSDDGKVMLCYQSNTGNSPRSTVVAEFLPVFSSKEEIQEQVKLITSFSANPGDKKQLKAEITSHLYSNYGKLGNEEMSRIFGL